MYVQYTHVEDETCTLPEGISDGPITSSEGVAELCKIPSRGPQGRLGEDYPHRCGAWHADFSMKRRGAKCRSLVEFRTSLFTWLSFLERRYTYCGRSLGNPCTHPEFHSLMTCSTSDRRTDATRPCVVFNCSTF